jgi:hypothetical protein
MSVKTLAAQRDKTVAPVQRARVDADPSDEPPRLAADQPPFTKLGQLL